MGKRALKASNAFPVLTCLAAMQLHTTRLPVLQLVLVLVLVLVAQLAHCVHSSWDAPQPIDSTQPPLMPSCPTVPVEVLYTLKDIQYILESLKASGSQQICILTLCLGLNIDTCPHVSCSKFHRFPPGNAPPFPSFLTARQCSTGGGSNHCLNTAVHEEISSKNISDNFGGSYFSQYV